MTFRYIPGGSFEMGPSGSADPRYRRLIGAVHKVTLKPFWMSAYLTTNIEFEHYKRRKRPPSSLGDNTPIVNIRHEDAVRFAVWLSRKEHRKYVLPTEAQWEYAARGGLIGMDYPWGNENPDGRAAFARTTCEPVGTYPPNGYGLYDMAGNANEFVRESNYEYSPLEKIDPIGPTKGKFYIMRGGGLAWELRVFERDLCAEDLPLPDLGFRLVCEEK